MKDIITKAIVYPLARFSASAKGAESIELRLSLRSVEKHWKGGGEIYILGAECPEFIDREKVTFIKAPKYMEAIKQATDLADKILWMNDDVYFLQPTSWDHLEVWDRYREITTTEIADKMKSANIWIKNLARVAEKLRSLGLRADNYSSHRPYVFESEKLAEVVELFDFGHKTPIETAYANFHRVKHKNPSGDFVRWTSKAEPPLDWSKARFFNHNDDGFTPMIEGFLRGQFPISSSFEK